MINHIKLDEDHIVKETLQRMAQIAEFHHPGIQSHLERIRGYALILSENIGLSLEEAVQISIASMLHDIGMVGIPDAVIAKTGELSHDEWELVKQHPIIGAEILGNIAHPILQIGEMVALTHHERWDGSGYPKGLKGEDIPLGGRICGLADVFDAITSDRPYRDRVPVETALELIKESSGLFFDPQLVEVFERKFDEILKVRSENI